MESCQLQHILIAVLALYWLYGLESSVQTQGTFLLLCCLQLFGFQSIKQDSGEGEK